MARLLQWLQQRMSRFHRTTVSDRDYAVRREVTVQTEERIVVLRSQHIQDVSVCPLCGQTLLVLKGQNSPEDSGDHNEERPGRLR